MSKVFIVIVNFNNFEDTIECIESVLKSYYSNFQIIVIDNSLNDESFNYLSNWINGNNFPDITTDFKSLVFPVEKKPVENKIVSEEQFITAAHLFTEKVIITRTKNNGFAAANNIALRYILKNAVEDSLIWILNNDTVIEKTTLGSLVDFYQLSTDPNIVLGSKLRDYYDPDKIQAIAGYYNTWLGKHTHIGSNEIDTGQYDNFKPAKNNYIVGASMFLPLLFLKKVGLMSEEYFLYFEEIDWINESLRYGFKQMFAPKAIVYHKEGASITGKKKEKRDTSAAEYYSIINRVRFIKKWYPYKLITVLPGVMWALTKRIFKGKFKLVKKMAIAVFNIIFVA